MIDRFLDVFIVFSAATAGILAIVMPVGCMLSIGYKLFMNWYLNMMTRKVEKQLRQEANKMADDIPNEPEELF